MKGKLPKLSQQQCYITLKNYKPEFLNKLSYRITFRAKTFIAKRYKASLCNINSLIRSKISLKQKKNM